MKFEDYIQFITLSSDSYIFILVISNFAFPNYRGPKVSRVPLSRSRIASYVALAHTQVHVQHAARGKATGEDEEKAGVAADALPEGQSDRRSSGWLRGSVQGLESSLPMGGFLYRSFPSGMWKMI